MTNPVQNSADQQKSSSAVFAIVIVVVIALAALLLKPALASTFNSSHTTEGISGQQQELVASTGNVTTANVKVEGMSFVPSIIEVPAGDELQVTFENTGDQHHDLRFANGVATAPLAPGESETIDVGVITNDLDGWCTLPGHRQMGMTLQVVAVGAPSTNGMEHSGTASASHGVENGTAPSMDQLIAAAQAADPYPAELPALTGETKHEFTFTVTEDEEELAAGVIRPVWSYNGTSPGPTLHGRIGDTFTITLVNEGTMGHSIDFHAGEIAPDQPMRTIEPGESLVYQFTANRSGIWMYHCSTMPMSTHIANGMFGAVVIEPEDLEKVDRSYVLIQSDIYLDTGSASADKLGMLQPDLLAFNGKPFQYDAHPLVGKAGERIRFWVLDVGPNSPLSFHVVGGQFDTVWSEGSYSVYRGESTDGITRGLTGAQVLPLMAAQGGFVEMVPLEAGRYPFVNHIMSLAEKGAHGILEISE